MNKVIATSKAPAAIGPYSQAIMAGDLLFTSGQLGINPTTGQLEGDTIQSQGRQALTNVKAIVEEVGMTMNDVVKTTVFIADMSLFQEFNEVYASFFSAAAPARSCVAVKALPKNALVEVEAIAHR